MIAFRILYSGATCWSKTGASSIWREGRAVRRSKGIERRIEQRFCFRFSIGGRTNRKGKRGATNTERERKEKTPIFEVRIAFMYSHMLVFCSGGALRSRNRHRANEERVSDFSFLICELLPYTCFCFSSSTIAAV